MTIGVLRSVIISTIFFGYVAILLLLISCWILDGFDFDEFTTALAVILPLVGAHIATIITFSQNNPRGLEKDAEIIMILPSAIALTTPILFVMLMFLAILAKAFNVTSISFEQFKILLACINGMFGAYVATLVGIYLKPVQESRTSLTGHHGQVTEEQERRSATKVDPVNR
ncbi:hypothetical protein ACC718_14960 [Rhizobium ruizarguesonis]